MQLKYGTIHVLVNQILVVDLLGQIWLGEFILKEDGVLIVCIHLTQANT